MTEFIPPRPEAPICPEASACCDSGCDPCIFDFYREELEEYRLALARWEAEFGQTSTSHTNLSGHSK